METGEKEYMKKFTTFEGIDGSGKTTIASLLHKKLLSRGYQAILTFEPTDTTLGKFVQECIKTNSNPYITAFSFIADRIQHCQSIQKWLSEENIVLCDRYAESTYAYQGAQLQGEMKHPIRWLQDISKTILTPDRTFLFQISPRISIQRIQHRQELIPFERVSFLEKVEKNYTNLSKGKRFLCLDATKSIDELVDLCYNDIIS